MFALYKTSQKSKESRNEYERQWRDEARAGKHEGQGSEIPMVNSQGNAVRKRKSAKE